MRSIINSMNFKASRYTGFGSQRRGQDTVIMYAFEGPIDYSFMRPSDIIVRIRDYPAAIDLSKIPPWVTKVTLSNCGVTSLIGLNPSVESLNLRECEELTTLAGLPDSLVELDLYKLAKLKWEPAHLPRALRALLVSGTYHAEANLRGLPSAIEVMSLCGLPALRTTDGFPKSLRGLGLFNLSRLQDLRGVPHSLVNLQLSNCPRVSILPFCPSITTLSLGQVRSYRVYTPDGADVISDSSEASTGRTVKDDRDYNELMIEYIAHMVSRKKRAA